MTLPGEALAATYLATTFKPEFERMTRLHDAVVGMLGKDWTITKSKGLDPIVTYTVAGLLTKACKSFRAVQILCAAGLGTDAGTIARTLFETSIASTFILQKQSKQRARIFHAHSRRQALKMLNHWKQTPGLKRKATKAMFIHVNAELDDWSKGLLPGTNTKRHWSGKGSFEEAAGALKGSRIYAVFYRHTSTFTHVTDFRDHVHYDTVTDRLMFKLPPGGDHIDGLIAVSNATLWLIAARINERLGLGCDAVLHAELPPSAKE